MRWMIVLCQWIMSQLLKESYENWDIEHPRVVYSGSNTDCKSSEPLKTIVMLCYVMYHDCCVASSIVRAYLSDINTCLFIVVDHVTHFVICEWMFNSGQNIRNFYRL